MKEHYDLLYFMAPTLTPEEVATIHKNAQDLIVKHGGKITKETTVGKRKLAYKIKQHKYGIYLNVYFEIEPEKITDLNTIWRLDSTILRHLVVKGKPRLDLNFKPASFEEHNEAEPGMHQEKVRSDRQERRSFTPPTTPKTTTHVSMDKTVPVTATTPVQSETPSTAKDTKVDDKKVTLEELDEKLDKILSDEITK